MTRIRNTKEQTTIYNTLHRKLKVEQHKPPLKTEVELMCSCSTSGTFSKL